jgi:lysophospholipase L1-like esterase
VSRQVFMNLALSVGAILFFCMVGEIALRLTYAHSLDFSMEMWKYAVQLKRSVDNPELSFAHAPNRSAFLMGVQVSTNSHGLRDREYPLEKPAGVYRIVMLGDSTTLGWGVPVEQTVAKILETRLNGLAVPGRRFEVLNAGVGNYDTVQEVAHYLTYDRAYHPDMVILQYFINDAEPVPREKHIFLLGQSYLVAFAASRSDAMLRFAGKRPNWKEYYGGLYRDGRPGFEAAKNALARLADLNRADHTPLLVTLLPELHEINGTYPFSEAHRKIEDVLAKNHVPAMELIEGLRGHGPERDLWVTPADDHPNGTANSLIAAQMIPWILARVTGENPLADCPKEKSNGQ